MFRKEDLNLSGFKPLFIGINQQHAFAKKRWISSRTDLYHRTSKSVLSIFSGCELAFMLTNADKTFAVSNYICWVK